MDSGVVSPHEAFQNVGLCIHVIFVLWATDNISSLSITILCIQRNLLPQFTFSLTLEPRGSRALLLISHRHEASRVGLRERGKLCSAGDIIVKMKKISRERDRKEKCIVTSFPGIREFRLLNIRHMKKCAHSRNTFSQSLCGHRYVTDNYLRWVMRPFHSIHHFPPSAAQTNHNYSIKLSFSAGRLSLIGIHSCPLNISPPAAGSGAATPLHVLRFLSFFFFLFFFVCAEQGVLRRENVYVRVCLLWSTWLLFL